MKKFIVTKTIFKPSKALLMFANIHNWQSIVVCDKKTSHTFTLKKIN
jgi:hypothetical protein